MKMFSLLLKMKLRLFYKLQKMEKKTQNRMRVLQLSKEGFTELFFSEYLPIPKARY